MENQIVGTKITRPRVGQCKNKSPKGWMGGELMIGTKNNSLKTEGMDGTKITRQRDGQMES